MILKRAVRINKMKTFSKYLLLLFFCLSILVNTGRISASSLSEKEAQLKNLQSQIDEYQAIINQKQQEAASLQAQIATIDASLAKTNLEIQETQVKIDQTQSEIDETEERIEQKEKEMEEKKKILKECIKRMYEQEKVNIVEILISSSSLSDFMDQIEYISVVENRTKNLYDEILAIKNELVKQRNILEGKKTELVKLKNEQEVQKRTLEGQMATKQSLLDQTKGEEANYQNLLSAASLQAKQAQLEIAAAIRASRDGGAVPRGGNYRGGGGYPWAGMHGIDPWGFYMGQCTSYAAWKRAAVGKPIPAWGYMYPGSANAKDWIWIAPQWGYQVDRNPAAGCIMVFPSLSSYGHVAYVESVSGSTVYFSDYNGWGGWESYGEGVININNWNVLFIH